MNEEDKEKLLTYFVTSLYNSGLTEILYNMGFILYFLDNVKGISPELIIEYYKKARYIFENSANSISEDIGFDPRIK